MAFDIGALGASTLSACCLLGSARPWRVWSAAALMVLAMLGCVLASVAPGVGMIAIALSLASAAFALHRRAGRVSPMSLHRALGGVTMAALVAHSLSMRTPQPGVAHAHHGVSLIAIVVAFVAGFLAYSAWLLVAMSRADAGTPVQPGRRRRRMLAIGEVSGMVAGVLLMSMM
ncbi:hypothetical protein [Leifsonia poae]|uniref:hypothetical protein n=1 Tax=Leifsonia poae TaxID=110933 RepID=UPI001CBEDC7A|nr:hypothetical protein [Leifsonia poae]